MEAVKQQSKQMSEPMPVALMSVPRPWFKRTAAAPEISNNEAAAPNHEQKQDTSAELEQPAVISVKKGRAGCAVVLLRDPAIIERCVLQRVAVVDGICIEMTRHTKSRPKVEEEGAEPPAGIFCAWGMRVERRFPVSAEGLEEFFNSLAGKQSPAGLVAHAPFEESHLSFQLKSEAFAPLSFDVRAIPANAQEILRSPNCNEDCVLALQAAKDRLDALWDKPPPPVARSVMARVARSQLFPHSGEGGQEHENRAGDKLAELSAVADLFDGIPVGAAFLDLCGGPGAWSQHILARKDLALRGFGFTLKAGAVGGADDWQADAKDEWYPDLLAHSNWTALWGADGTGDLLKPGNLQHVANQLANEQVLLCVADGGFSDKEIPPHLLELYFYRLFLAELLMATSCLSLGGKFVCKFYTSFSASTSALLFLTTRLFDSVEVVKPMSSRATGPERYLVASGFHGNSESDLIQAALERSHALGRGASPLAIPLLAPPVTVEAMAQDQAFTASMKAMVVTLCERQSQALNAVVDRAEFLEEIAMECAVCSDPFSKIAVERREDITEGREQKERDRESRRHRNIPTPARGAARENWKGSHRQSRK